MATYNGTSDIQHFSSFLKSFVIPVSPHVRIKDLNNDEPHIHTIPEWRAENVWVLSIHYISKSAPLGRWGDKRSSSGVASPGVPVTGHHHRISEECSSMILDWGSRQAQKWSVAFHNDKSLFGDVQNQYQVSS